MYKAELERQLTEIKKCNKPIVIFGTMLMGIMAKKGLTSFGIEVACFCDNDICKQGEELEGIKVLSLSEIRKQYSQAVFIIASFKESSFIAIKEQLNEAGYTLVYNKDAAQYAFYVYHLSRESVSEDIARTLELQKKRDALIMDTLAIFLTEKCSLNCKNCSVCIPYIQNPRDYDIDKILSSLRSVADSVDCINNISVAGGEALLHNDLIKFCKEASKIGKILNINIFTNGNTFVNEDKFIELSKYISKLHITDYGRDVSKQKDILLEKAKEKGIICEYKLESMAQWYELGNFTKRKELKLNLSTCQFPIANTMGEDKLYYCGRGRVIGDLFPELLTPRDYVDLSSEKDKSSLNDEIRSFICDTEHLEYCKYCNGHLGNKVIAGEQTKEKWSKMILLEEQDD